MKLISSKIPEIFAHSGLSHVPCPFADGETVQDIVNNSGKAFGQDTAIMMSIGYAMAEVIDKDFGPFKPGSRKLTADDGSKLDFKDLTKDVKLKEIDVKMAQFLVNNIAPAKKWGIMLAVAHQQKNLRTRNISALFKSFKLEVNGEIMLPYVNWVSFALPNLGGIEELIKKFKEIKWLEYHTAISSSSVLCKKVIDFMEQGDEKHEVRKLYFSDNQKTFIQDAAANIWDAKAQAKVSTVSIGISYCFLKAIRMLPESWYQGQDAMEEMAAFMKLRYLAGFEKYAEIKADLKSITSKNDALEVMKATAGAAPDKK